MPYLKFELEKWINEINEALDSYSSLHDPITCGNAMKSYYEGSNLIECIVRGTAVTEKEKTGNILSDEELNSVRDKYIKEFSESAMTGLLVYKRQMLVIASTIFEALITEFLKCYFVQFPNSMYSHVSEDGTIKFKDLLEFDTKENLLQHYACLSAKRFTSKPWKKVFSNLEKLLKQEFAEKDLLLKMLLQRNEIIHEAKKLKVSNSDVYDYFRAIETMCIVLDSTVKIKT